MFDIDIERCTHCGGTLKIIAAIEDPPVIARILARLGLPNGGEALSSVLFGHRRAPAHRFDLFQAA